MKQGIMDSNPSYMFQRMSDEAKNLHTQLKLEGIVGNTKDTIGSTN